MREILQEILGEHGHVTSVTTGVHFRADMAQDCDLLVGDLYMPGREGLEIMVPRNSRLSMASITAFSTASLREQARCLGIR
jgi:CheY-like chemotaxis protein